MIALGVVPREQKTLKGHLPRVLYHRVYLVYGDEYHENERTKKNNGHSQSPGPLSLHVLIQVKSFERFRCRNLE